MKKLLLVLAIVGIVSTPGLSAAQQLFDFTGQALQPASVGGDLTAYLFLTNDGLIDTPIPLDYGTYEYTIVVTGLTLDLINGNSRDYSGGTIVLYEDNATAADLTNPATFSDGTALLSGDVTTFVWSMFFTDIASGLGDVNWTGGTRIDDIAPPDRLGWPMVVSISTRATNVEPGYDERWNGKVEPLEPVVSGGESSVSDLKTRHR